jgi:hypothetical protein
MQEKKICLVSLRNIYAMSCLPRYVECFGDNKFDIVYWDHNDIEETCGAENYYVMKYKTSNKDSRWRKLIGYVRFIWFSKRLLKINNYDKVILLPTQTGVLLYPFLKKKYAGKYIIDIRDYTAENNKLFYNIEKKLIKNSGVAVITSPAFKRFLPEHEYIVSHNTTNISKDIIQQYRKRKKFSGETIIVSCIGGIRFYEQFKKVIDCFGNDKRFLLRFIGNGSEGLKEYCEQNKYENVELLGRFEPKQTIDFYMNTDIIMNLYGNNNPLLDYALSNKLYYAATLGIPILVCPSTYMEEVAVSNGFGFTFDLEDETMRDKLYEYYHLVDWDKLYKNCDKFMEEVYAEEEEFINGVDKFISTI